MANTRMLIAQVEQTHLTKMQRPANSEVINFF